MPGVLTISSLGRLGRFGNTLFQVCTGLALARKLGAELQVPDDWVGRKIFKVDIPSLGTKPRIQTRIDFLPNRAEMAHFGAIDLAGFWQFQKAFDLYSRKDVASWLPFQDWVRDRFMNEAASASRRFRIAIHKRRGDYLAPPNSTKFCLVTDASFRKCLEEQVRVDHASADNIEIVELTDDTPRHDEVAEAMGVGFLPDFMAMVTANVVIRSNSSFSFWAAFMGNNEVYSPVVEEKVGWHDVEFVRGNHPRMADSKNHPYSKLTDLSPTRGTQP